MRDDGCNQQLSCKLELVGWTSATCRAASGSSYGCCHQCHQLQYAHRLGGTQFDGRPTQAPEKRSKKKEKEQKRKKEQKNKTLTNEK